MLFTLLGVLAWTEFASRPNVTPRVLVLGLLGGMSMGVAVTCRQYLLAVPAAAVLFILCQWRNPSSSEKSLWSGIAMLSLVLAIVPVLLLVLIWKGISSPGMVAGTSYTNLKATVGLNFFRPLIAAFYSAVYLVPLSFPTIFRLKGSQRRVALVFAILAGAVITLLRSSLLQPGPLNSLIQFASRLPRAGALLFAVIAVVAVYNAVSVCSMLWEQRQALSSCAPAVFALMVIVFFIAEQVGVGGNLAFFDRYVLQLAPFLGLVAFAILPRPTPARISALAGLSVLSHVMLWRYAFGV
jgi:hypothetical protein